MIEGREDKIVVVPNGCHIWIGACTGQGYGRIRIGGRRGRTVYPHRVAYEEQHGEIPEGMVIDHLCRDPRCCNADHLEAVTQAENCRRAPKHVVHGDEAWRG